METSMINSMCRCCASEGAFKDVKTTYHWMGEEEIYADMLKDCFDISLFYPEEGEDGGICEVCITQLRNAVNFKKQVLHTEDQFKKHLQGKLFKPSIVKVEIPMEPERDSDDNNVSPEEGYSEPEYEIPIKTEAPEESEKQSKSKKRAATVKKATTSRAKKAKTEDGETSTKREHQERKIVIEIEPIVETKTIKQELTVTKEVSVDKEVKNPIKKPKVLVAGKNKINKYEVKKHRENLKEILRWSNATPVSNNGCVGYTCCYCKYYSIKAEDIKKHTNEEHFNTDIGFTKLMGSANFIIRLDITSLHCKICNKNMETLEELMDHLRIEHDKKLHTDIKNHIIPFKFDTENLQCCICHKVFAKFGTLREHMTVHYRNFICDICDVGFVNYIGLTSHLKSHNVGKYTCEYCSKVYDTSQKKYNHIRTVHHNKPIHKCKFCTATFNDYRKKETHLSSVHGIGTEAPKCQDCDKTFCNRKMLNIHVKRDHLIERSQQCPTCEMKFLSQ